MSNTTNLKTVLPGNAPMAADVDQMRSMLAGTADIGFINLPSSKAAPSAPTLALNGAGVVNYAVKYQIVAVTGWKDSVPNFYMSGFVPSPEASITASNNTVNVTIPAFSAPIIGYAIYRTAGAGASGTELYVGFWSNTAGGTFSDNLADASRGTGMQASASAVSIPSAVPTTNTTGTVLCLNGGANNISAPTQPLIMASSNVHGIGMDQYGIFYPINPASVTTGDYWGVYDKNGANALKIYIDGGTAIDVNKYLRCFGGLYVPSGQSTYLINGVGNNYSQSVSALASGSSLTITHNLGHQVCWVALSGTMGNLSLTYSFTSTTQMTLTNYSSGSNAWTGTIYLW